MHLPSRFYRFAMPRLALSLFLAAGLLFVRAPFGAAAQQTADTTEDAAAEEGLPLEAERRFSFETQEGSWMSLDVHPDGRSLVFDLMGDLYQLPTGGGEAEPLTRGMAFDSQPRISPDGERVLFVSDRSGSENLWSFELGGTDTTQITTGTGHLYQSPTWAPDGDYVVASRSAGLGTSKLRLFPAGGGSGTALVSEPEGLKMMGAAFGESPRRIWYAERMDSWDYNAQFPQYQLAVYDRETGERHQRSSRFGSAFRPTLSPDGKWLVYGTRHDEHTGLRLRNRETGAERWLAYPVQHDEQESRATLDVLPGMSFTPDSEALVASYGGKIWRLPIEEGGEAEEIPFTAQVDQPVGPNLTDFQYPVEDDPTFAVRQIRDAVPSPSGDRLAFTALDQLYVMDYPGGSPERVADLNEGVGMHSPAWSPDGNAIAFVMWSEEGNGQIRRVSVGSGAQQMQTLTRQSAYYRDLAWSPDGERLVAIRSAAQAFQSETGTTGSELIQIPASGGAVERVTLADDLSDPHFTEDPDRVYAYSDERGLLSMRFDGTDVQTHLQITGGTLPGADEPLRASTALMGPNGDWALAQVVNDLYVVDVPYVGGETPTLSVSDPEQASFPVRQLTDIGGQFPAWGPEGQRVHWSIGNAHFVYDLQQARRMEEEREADQQQGDDAETDEEGYEPSSQRIQVTAERDLPTGSSAVLRGARVIPMAGDGDVIENADVVIEGNRIAAVGPRGSVDVPRGAEVIDVSGKTIMPGLVDAHSHLRPPGGVHKRQVWQYLANLSYGVTTTHDPQTGTTDVLTYGDLVRSGRIRGPRIYSTGPGIFRNEQVESLGHARDVMRRYSEYYDTETIKMYLSGNRQQRQWLLQAAREQRITPTTEGGLDFRLGLTMLIDGYPGHEHNFPVYPLYRDVVELTARAGMNYTPTLLVTYGGPWAENYFYTTRDVHDNDKLNRFTPHHELDQRVMQRPWFHEDRQSFDEHAQFVADLVEAGGRVGVGGHGQLQGLGTHWELWAMASGGLANRDALRAATLFGAEFIGRGQDLGSIEEGKLADLLVLNENPLRDLRHTTDLRYVMKGGRLYDAETLDEVYPRERPLGEVWWEGRVPQAEGLPGLGEDAGAMGGDPLEEGALEQE